ncbi:unnamed protein product [Rotaria sordida]|uniref:Helitron helicase-like domain-containing protein n=2 Tax=Rotaria sordida TaxID=392033 RepID=A0A819EKG3_9BILA|nr:unnamed protein product [Rotaria sordida]CAF3851437.1 unnamed protein product [Rotaria sordida]
MARSTQSTTNQVNNVTDCSPRQSSNNRVAAWRERRKEKETEAEREMRVDEERRIRSNQRKNRQINETEEEHESRLIKEAINKRNRRCTRNLLETEECRKKRLDHEAEIKANERNNRNVEETEEEHELRLIKGAMNSRIERCTRNLLENEEDRKTRLDHEAQIKAIERNIRNLEETKEEHELRLIKGAMDRRIERCTRNLLENEEDRKTRLDHEAQIKTTERNIRNVEETEEEHELRLIEESISKRTRRCVRNLVESEEMRENRLGSEAEIRTINRHARNLKESEEERKIRLSEETGIAANRRRNRDLEEDEEKRSIRDELETPEEREQRLKLNNEFESIRRHKRCQNETNEERKRRKQQKRNADKMRHKKGTESSTEVWPKIATTEIKHHCLNAFKDAMSNHVVHQIICAICACLHYKSESVEMNIAKIPNQHLLYPNDEMPSCVSRINIEIDTVNGNVQMSEEIQERLMNTKDSSVIINKMLLCLNAIDLTTGFVYLCNKCHKYLLMNKLPCLSLNNLMWIGDVPEELQGLTLPEEKLIGLYRHSSCVIKLSSITGDPSLAQTALKGNVITFPQNVSDIARSLPLSPNTLPEIIKIIFVGRTFPKKDRIRSILTVRRDIIRKALIWLSKNNILYKDVYIDDLLIDTLPINDVPDCLWNTMSLVDEQQSCNVERSGYVKSNLDSDEVCFTDVISLNASGLMDTSATAISSSDIRQHLRQRINITEELTMLNYNIYLVPHSKNPVTEYFNTSFLPGLYPTLFPYGMGGVEDERRLVRVPYGKHIRYFLSYHDHRFEMNTSFIFVTFNILQRRTACAKARILVSRPYFSSQSTEINQLTAAEVKIALNQIESNTFTYNSNPRLSALLKQLKTVSGSVMGSNQSRANCRVQLHSQIFFSGLPNIFITINPCDLHHPLAMKFAGVDLDIDNLMVHQMPKSQDRAAIVAKHPVAIARFFNKLITTVLSTLIGYDTNKHTSNPGGGVLGEIDAYYGTVEESGRGALHLHMLLWLTFRHNLIEYLEDIIKEDLRSFQNDISESDVSNVDKHNRNLISICSAIPSPNDPHFEQIKKLLVRTFASENQIHRHTSTCYKYIKGLTIDDPPCRLRYPKEMYDETTIDLETGEIRMKRDHPMMNNFNEWLLLACRCNGDIKFIWSGADTKALVYYISDYITKKNLSFHDTNSLIYQAVDKFEKNAQNISYTDALDKSRRLILRCFNTLASQQEISSVQVASYLMGWPDHYTSHTFVNIHLIGIERYLEQSLTKLKEKSNSTTNESFMIDDLRLNLFESFHENYEQDDEQNESFELEAGIDEEHLVLCNKRIDYELRSLELSHVCLYDFYSEYRKTKITTADKVLFEVNSIPTSEARRGRPLNDRWLFQPNHPQYFSHLIIRRSFNVVPVLIGPAIPRRDREDTAERYARAILTLFYPWRSPLNVCELDQTWRDALKVREATFTARSNKVINNIQVLHDCKRDRDSDLIQLVNQPLPSRPVNTSSPYNDADIEDAEEILALLDESNHLNPSSLNERAIEG